MHVIVRFGNRQRRGLAAKRDSLAQLEQLWLGEREVELGLAGEHDLDQLFAVHFEIQEHADFFKDLEGETLRLIDDQDGMLPGAAAREEPVVQGLAHVARVSRIFLDAEIGEDEIVEIVDVEMRIKNEGHREIAFAK